MALEKHCMWLVLDFPKRFQDRLGVCKVGWCQIGYQTTNLNLWIPNYEILVWRNSKLWNTGTFFEYMWQYFSKLNGSFTIFHQYNFFSNCYPWRVQISWSAIKPSSTIFLCVANMISHYQGLLHSLVQQIWLKRELCCAGKTINKEIILSKCLVALFEWKWERY
jgi:hypothetical protein